MNLLLIMAYLTSFASGIALHEHNRKTVTMRDIKIAKTADSLLEKKVSLNSIF